MSVYSTRRVSRSEAIRMVMEKLNITDTNDQLGDVLDKLYSKETYNNYIVYDDHESLENEND